ncbi:DNA-binding response regulator [Marinobacterium nitratireducens]|uniref:DNA-binding response regulator n=1 Tax=Marinobacterium nitratireducens TaxID=518897 RepID=A0A918DXX3_9GAMM|nr:response regulator [Marinobacterium nitratireducens]GGO89250.1 DNA-binding response regulator [Marinobacterium nitratireducens]
MNAKVLVVDDSPEAISMLNELLCRHGFQVFVALGGEQVINIAEQILPDVILLDAVMPGMDGFEVCRRLKAIPSLIHVPVIFMTGLSETEHIVRAFEVGGIDYITKPIRHEELLVRMRAHLHTAQRAASAHGVMDEFGLMTICLRSDGRIEWATPQVYKLFPGLGVETGPALMASLVRARVGGAPVTVTLAGEEVKCHMIDDDGLGRYLFKLDDPNQPDDQEKLSTRFALTEREAEVLMWIVHGKTNKEIAMILDLSPRTVNKHLEQIFPKLGVENRTSAASAALNCIRQRWELS